LAENHWSDFRWVKTLGVEKYLVFIKNSEKGSRNSKTNVVKIAKINIKAGC